jgi:hypothetical protein
MDNNPNNINDLDLLTDSLDGMGWLKTPLENAIKNTYPMRSIKPSEWIYAGNFTIKGKTYAFYGEIATSKVTCRCVDADDYPNHWFELLTGWTAGDDGWEIVRVTKVGRYVG